jgi:AcrR family transcriptional regulator
MAAPVKRRYDNSGREARVRATKTKVVDAARELLVEQGYTSTTVDAIAAASDTPIATVYRLFGSKIGILTAVLEVSFVGDDRPVALHEREDVQTAAAQTDPRVLLSSFAHVARDVLGRSGKLHQVLRSAATGDEEAAALLAEINRQRLEGQSRVARLLDQRGALADGINRRAAADVIYTLMSPDVHRLLTEERHWSAGRYEQWLADALCALLLRDPSPTET